MASDRLPLRGISGVEVAQAINYLRVSGLKRALILNFGAKKLEIKRLVWTARHDVPGN